MIMLEIDEFNPEIAFIHENVCFDAKKGIGNTSNSNQINYFGFVAFLPPQQFRSFALLKPVQQMIPTVDFFLDMIPSGKACISPPFLTITNKQLGWGESHAELDHWIVTGHEGRHRSYTLNKLGLKSIPVFFFPYGKRSRDIDVNFIKGLNPIISENKVKLNFTPDYVVINKKVYACGKSREEVRYLETRWDRPMHVSTETKSLLDSEGFNFIFSKPK